MKQKVIITGNAHEYLSRALTNEGYDVAYLPQITYDELYVQIDTLTGLVLTTRILVDKHLLDAANNLKWIGRLGSGMENIDVAYAATKKIVCVNSPEGNRTAVAEQALGMLLQVVNNLARATAEVKQGIWLRDENRGIELTGKTVGIIGYGNTGEALAKLLQPFDVTILAYDKYRAGFGGGYIKEANLEQIARYAQVISFHLPLTAETKHMANAKFFTALEQKPYIVNTSRGKVIDTTALLQALEYEQIAGAALDVLENENLKTYTPAENKQLQQLLSYHNVMVTPHIAGYTHEAHYKMSEILYKKIRAIQ